MSVSSTAALLNTGPPPLDASPSSNYTRPPTSSPSDSSLAVASTQSNSSAAQQPNLSLKPERSDRPPRPRVTRVRTGCLTCRRRKKKCDEQRCPETGGCMRCRRAGFECVGFPQIKRMPGGPAPAEYETTPFPAAALPSTSTAAPVHMLGAACSPSAAPTTMSGTSVRMHPYHHPDHRRVTALSSMPTAPTDPRQPRDISLSPTTSPMALPSSHSLPHFGAPNSAPPPFSVPSYPCSTIGDCLLSGNPICNHCLSAIQPGHLNPMAVAATTHALAASPLTSSAAVANASQNAPISPVAHPDLSTQLPKPTQLSNSVAQESAPVESGPAQWHVDPLIDVGAGSNLPSVSTSAWTFNGDGSTSATSLPQRPDTAFVASSQTMLLGHRAQPSGSLPHTAPTRTQPPSSDATSARKQDHRAHLAAIPGTPWPSTKESILGYYGAVITCWVEGCHPSQIGRSRLFEGIVRSLFTQIDTSAYLRLSVAAVAACYIGGDQLRWPEDLTLIQRWSAGLRCDSLELPQLQPPPPSSQDERDSHSSSTSHHASKNAGHQGPSLHTQQTLHQHLDRHLTSYSYHLRRMATQALDEELNAIRQGPLNSWPNADGKISADSLKRYDSLIVAAMNLAIFNWAEVGLDAYFSSLNEAIQIVHTILGGRRRLCWSQCHDIDALGLSMLVWADTSAAIARGTEPFFIIEVDESSQSPDPQTGSQRHRPRGQPSDATLPADETDSERFPISPFNCPDLLLKALSDIAHLRTECDVATKLEQHAYIPNVPPFGLSAAGLASVLDGADGALDEEDEDEDEDDDDSLIKSPKKPAQDAGTGLHDGDMAGELRDAGAEACLGKHLPPRLRRRARQIQRTLSSSAMLATTRAQSYFGSPGCAEMSRLAAQLLLYQTVYRVGPLFPSVRRCVRQVLHVWTNSHFALEPEKTAEATPLSATDAEQHTQPQATWHGAREYCVAVGCGNYLFPVFMAAAAAITADERETFRDALCVIGHNEAAPGSTRDAVFKGWTATRRTGYYVHPLQLVAAGHARVGFF